MDLPPAEDVRQILTAAECAMNSSATPDVAKARILSLMADFRAAMTDLEEGLYNVPRL